MSFIWAVKAKNIKKKLKSCILQFVVEHKVENVVKDSFPQTLLFNQGFERYDWNYNFKAHIYMWIIYQNKPNLF